MAISQTQATNPFLLIKEIQDVYIRKNFQNLSDYFGAQNQFLNFKFIELVFTAAQSNALISHGLGFVPQDILLSKITGPGTITFNYGLFDPTYMNVSVTDACRVRFFYGTYWNFLSQVPSNSLDKASFTATPSGTSVSSSTGNPFTITTLPLSSPGSTPTLYTVSAGGQALLVDATKREFMIQLPLGSILLGETLIIEKTDSSFNPVTIRAALSTSDTIDSLSTLVLSTYLERVVLLATSSGYRVVSRDYFRGWNGVDPGFGSSLGTPPTFGGISTQSERWRREGPDCILEYNLEWTIAGTAGSGDYWIKLPFGLNVDTSVVPVNSNNFLGVAGSALLVVNGVTSVAVPIINSNGVLLIRDSGGVWGSGYKDASTGAGSLSLTARIPIQGWGG